MLFPRKDCADDGSFGPVARGCRANFDFTLSFELAILLIVPASVFILLSAFRISNLATKPKSLGGRWFQIVKLVCCASFAVMYTSDNGVIDRGVGLFRSVSRFVDLGRELVSHTP